MRKISLFIILFIASLVNQVKADEGMWLPLLVNRLNYVDMKKMGLQLTAEEIYSINNSSMKDAIVMLNGGNCSAFMVSGEGLMMTNHHCGLEYVQKLSTAENDYVDLGFWATSKAEELRNEKISASFLSRMENVTDKVLAQLNSGLSETDRDKKIQEVSEKLVMEAISGTEFNAEVKSFFNGNEYYLFVYETFKDVRLVGAPPKALGNFGADSDNWTWPRQTADFLFFRVYASPQGKPADYNKKNIPYVPKHFLPVSLKGIQKDDFTMVMGYPATTDRFTTSYGVKLVLDKLAPTIVNIREAKLKVIKAAMDGSEEIRLQYISKYNSSSNYWKYFIGQKEILTKLKAYDKKKDIENKFTQWIALDPTRKAKYSEAISIIEKANSGIEKYYLSKYYFMEIIKRPGFEILAYANQYEELYNELAAANPNQEKIDRLATSLKYQSTKYFKSYDLETDKKIFVALIQMYYNDIPKDQHPDVLEQISKKFKGDFQKFADDLFEKSIFANKDKVQEFLTKPSSKILDKDPGYRAMASFYAKNKEILGLMKPSELELERGSRLFVAGIMEMEKDKKYYPNANTTMRLSYGKVCDYNKPNGKSYPFNSTMDDLMARYKPGDSEFSLPEKFVKLYGEKDFGRYASNGTVPTCFITNNDVTGGNSGAPIINGKGELIGIVFDINWEATASPIAFEPDLQRTICTDIRYIMWVIEKYAGATNIVSEMKVIE
ncbi:MAG: S46 family peptidase [Bacteroidota bacterium]